MSWVTTDDAQSLRVETFTKEGKFNGLIALISSIRPREVFIRLWWCDCLLEGLRFSNQKPGRVRCALNTRANYISVCLPSCILIPTSICRPRKGIVEI